MKKVILLLFIFSMGLFASDDGWWIYTYEDVSTLKAVFNYLAMIKTDSSYMNIINTVLIAGLTFTIIFKFLDIMAIPKYFLSVVGTMLIVFSVNTTVMVLNVKSYNSLNPKAENYAVIDNVPFIFAVLTSAFSNVGYHSALLIETLFTSIVNGQNTMEASFLKTGNLGAFKILDALDSIDALTINEDGKKFNKNMNEYLHYCIYSIAYALDSGLSTDIATKPDLFSFLDPINSPNQAIRNIANQKIIDSAGTISTCSQLYSRASNSLSVLKDSNVLYTKANSLLSKLTSNIDNAGSTVAKMMTNSNLGDAQADINNYIMMSGVRKAFENSWKNYGVGATSAQAGFGAGLAEANIQAQGKVKAKASSSMMPSVHSVLQAVMYVLFPLVLVVQLFAGGFAIFKNYILGLLWLELWIPAYSVLNYFTLKEAQTQALDKLISSTKDGGPEGYLTLANQNEIYNTIANQAAIAADFYIIGVPAIAGFILFASFHALSGITSGVAGSIAQYANNQSLNQERANIAALDKVNEQMKLNNPLYTGNIGTAQAMVSQETQISQASKAAGAFLASGSTLNDFNNLAKASTFTGMENMASNLNRTNLLTNNGNNRLIDGMAAAIDTSSIKTAQDSVVAGNLNKQMNSLGEGQLSVFSNATRMEDLKSNIVSPVAIDGKSVSKIVDGGSTTTENTEFGRVSQTVSEKGNVVQESIDGSKKANYNNEYHASTIDKRDNIKTADVIDTANNTFERINKTDTSNIKKADNIDTANNTFERINKTDTSNINKADNIDTANNTFERINKTDTSTINKNDSLSSAISTAVYTTDNGEKIEAIVGEDGKFLSTKVTQTTQDGVIEKDFDKDGNLVKSKSDGSDIINMDKKYSGMKTNEYTNNNGLVYKEYLDGNGNTVGRTVTEYSSSGYYVKDQRLSENGKWEDIRKSMDGSDKTDLSTQEDYSRIYKNNNTHEEMTTKDTSITLKDNFTLEAKNTWDAFNINQRINGIDAIDSFRQTMDNISAGATVKNWASNPIGTATDIYSVVKASSTNSNLQDGADRVNFEPDKNTYLKDRTDSFFSFGSDTKTGNDAVDDINSKANMFSAKEQTTASVNRESLLKGDTGTESELSLIKTVEDKIAGANLNKQVSAVGLNEGSLFNNPQNMKNFETNIVSGATDDGVKTEKLVGGGSSTTSYTPIGEIQQTLDNSGNVVQSSTDGSHKTDTSNINKADKIDTANNTFERINKTDTSTINKNDSLSSAISTAVYTTDNGEKIEAIVGEDGKFLSTKVTQTTQDGVIETNSNLQDGADRVNFEPDKNTYLKDRTDSFFSFGSDTKTGNDAVDDINSKENK